MSEEEKQITVVTPAMNLEQYTQDVNGMMALVAEQMHEGQDFGVIPYTNKKSLFDAGAEKLAKYFGLVPKYILVAKQEDWEKGFVYYKYKCELYHFKTGKFAGDAERSCNSKETKWAKKPVYDVANTVEAMAQKRAFVEAVKTATMASEIFFEGGERDNDTPPNKHTTKEEDPERARLSAALFATGKERGFSPETLKEVIYKKYNVKSLTELSNKDLDMIKDDLCMRFQVGVDKPTLIAPKEEKGAEVNHQVTIDEAIEGEVVEPTVKLCYNTEKHGAKHTVAAAPGENFCTPECKEEWSDKHYNTKKSTRSARP